MIRDDVERLGEQVAGRRTRECGDDGSRGQPAGSADGDGRHDRGRGRQQGVRLGPGARRREPARPGRAGTGLARPERRGQDDAGADPHHVAAAGLRARAGRRAGHRAGRRCAAVGDRAGRPVRRCRRDADRAGEPPAGRAAVPSGPGRAAAAGRAGARAVPAGRRRRPAGANLFRRHAAAAGPGRQPGGPAAGAHLGRADHRPGRGRHHGRVPVPRRPRRRRPRLRGCSPSGTRSPGCSPPSAW